MSNDDKAREIIEACMPNLWMIKELMDETNIVDVDLLRALYLIKNIQAVSKYGSVKITIKNGEVVSVCGENTFISEKELIKNLNAIKNK